MTEHSYCSDISRDRLLEMYHSMTTPAPEIEFESPRLRTLAAELDRDPTARSSAVASFWAEVAKAGTPLIERTDERERQALVTFLWRETEPTRAVYLSEAVSWYPADRRMLTRIERTDIWHLTWWATDTLRATYGFSVVSESETGDVEFRRLESRPDPLNRYVEYTNVKPDDLTSILVMPNAAPLPYGARREGIARGDLHEETFASAILGNERPVWVYTPPGYSPAGADYPYVVIFDGEKYNNAPNVLDALIADGEIPPMMAILVHQIGIRNQELPCNPDFSRAIATELIPWIRERWHISDDPAKAALNGCSFGGLCAAYTALKHHDVFGNAFMQSGSCWYHPSLSLSTTGAPSPTVGVSAAIPTIIGEYMASRRVPVRVYQECGDVENGPPPAKLWQVFGNRWLRDILELKGYDSHYVEFNGGHDDAWWRGTFADGIRWIFGAGSE